MGIFSKILNSEKLIDNISSGIDKSFHTSEEKVDNINKHLTLMQGFKILQRLLVMSITGVFLLTFLIAVGFVVCGGVETVNRLTTLVTEWQIHWSFLAIVNTYILGGVIPKKR